MCYTGHTLNNIAVVHFYRGDYEFAMDYYEQAKKFHAQFGFTWVYGFTYAFLCLFWELLNRCDKLFENLNRLRELNKTCRAIRADAWIAIKQGSLSFLEGNFDTAFSSTQQGLKIIKEVTHDAHMMSEALILLAKIEIARHNYTKALYYIKETLDYAVTLGRKQDIASSHLLYARFNYLKKDHEQSILHLRQSLEYAEKCGMKEIIWQAHHMLAKVHMRQKKQKQAKVELKKAKQALDIIVSNLGAELKDTYLKRTEVKDLYADLQNKEHKTQKEGKHEECR